MKPTAQRRRDRRALLDNLLGRALRGRLTVTEAALLAEQVREEQRAYDQTRRSLGETGEALGKHREAADAAIRELEQRALDAEEQLTAYRAVEEQRQAAAKERAARRLSAWTAAEDDVDGWKARAEQAEHRIGILLAVDEGRAHGAQRIMDERDQAQQRAERAEAAVAELAQAIRLTREYVGEDVLPAVEGWSWYDALRRHAPGQLAGTPELTPEAAAVHRAFAEAADSTTARLAEQQREHEIALATVRKTLSESETLGHRLLQRAEQAEAAVAQVKGLMDRRTRTLSQRAERAEIQHAEMNRHLDRMRTRAEQAEHRATRYRLAWLAARRDRKADRAAMAAEAPLVEFGRNALAAAVTVAQQRTPAVITDRAAIRNALDDPEPTPEEQ
ncbi:hypothetical protein [Streptomyces nigra]|uniref:hypothetical protein n=1 Tax=Streptomyces nigra TaxID=1827580 RepID=UPI003803AB4A